MTTSFFDNFEINITENSDLRWNYVKDINALIAGRRSMGKSYMAMNMALQLSSSYPYTMLYVIDYKNSDFSRLSELLPEGRVASTKEEIFDLLERYTALLNRRAKYFKSLPSTFARTARDLKMPAFYLIYDEFGAFTSDLDPKEKRRHDALLRKITLMGRQFGFGLIAILQQASVGNGGLDSSIHQQFGLKIHMGNATKSALRQTFGDDIETQDLRFDVGQGQLTMDSLTDSNMTRPFTAKKLNPYLLWKNFEINLYDQDEERALFDHK